MNAPPELKSSNPAPNTGEPTVLVGYDQTFFVTVRDPEGDDVTFEWSLSRSGPILNESTESVGQDGSEVSILTRSPDVELDGQTLRCVYWDEGNGEPQPALEWRLSVPKGGKP